MSSILGIGNLSLCTALLAHLISTQIRMSEFAFGNNADDIIIFAKNQEEHDKTLRLVLQRLREKNLTLNKAKCEFNKSQLKFCCSLFLCHFTSFLVNCLNGSASVAKSPIYFARKLTNPRKLFTSVNFSCDLLNSHFALLSVRFFSRNLCNTNRV
jgi:hypothetical protein